MCIEEGESEIKKSGPTVILGDKLRGKLNSIVFPKLFSARTSYRPGGRRQSFSVVSNRGLDCTEAAAVTINRTLRVAGVDLSRVGRVRTHFHRDFRHIARGRESINDDMK